MTLRDHELTLTESDLKEIFELFSSCSKYELARIYDPDSDSHYERTDLANEYDLTQEKREFALDSVRAVLYFLLRRGYRLEKDGEVLTLHAINDYFV